MKKIFQNALIGFLVLILIVLLVYIFDDPVSADIKHARKNARPHEYETEVVAEGGKEIEEPRVQAPVTFGAADAEEELTSPGEVVPEDLPDETPTEVVAERAYDASVSDIIALLNDDKPCDTCAVTNFMAKFNALTEEQKATDIHHALNLLSDAALPLFESVLYDQTQPKAVLEAVYNDLFNRDWDQIKMPMLRKVAATDGHPLQGEAKETLQALGSDHPAR